MRNQMLATTLVLLGLTVSCSHAPQTRPTGSLERDGRFEVIPLVGDFKVKRATLPNGLKLLVLKDRSSPTFAYQTWFNVGSRNEVIGKTGLAHLFEHLMFKGTKNHKEGEFDSLLEQAGAEDENAFTSHDHTVYVQELPKDALDLIVSLESDRMVNLIVNDQSFKTEREVVQNERRFRKENSPEGQMFQALFESAYKDHPYHWPVIGYEQDLNLMSAEDARKFYELYYSPDRATVVVVGDVDEDDVYNKVERAYGKIPSGNTKDVPRPQEVTQNAQRRVKLVLNVEVEKLWFGFKVPELASPDTAVIEMIQGLLAEGKNSRLSRALVDTGIASEITSGSMDLRDPGIFLVEADLQKGKSSLVAEPMILRELDRLKTTPVSQEEIQKVLNLMRFNFLSRISTAHGRANFIGQAETDKGGVEYALALLEKIKQVTPEQIQEVSKRIFDTSKLTLITAVPKKAK